MRIASVEETMGKFTSTVALVTSKLNGIANVMSAEWSLRVSLDPYLMAVFVAYERGTYRLIRESGEYGLNYCSDEQAHLAHIAGNHSIAEGEDKWKLADFRTFRAGRIAAPLIEGCVSNIECVVVDELKTGDHAVLVGKVVEGYTDDSKKPLVFHGGEFFTLGRQIEKKHDTQS